MELTQQQIDLLKSAAEDLGRVRISIQKSLRIERSEGEKIKCSRCFKEGLVYHFCNYGNLCSECYAGYTMAIPADGSFNTETDVIKVILPAPVKDENEKCPICG